MKLFSILFLSLFLILQHESVENKIEVIIKEDSRLFIKGTSNVNQFTCDYKKPLEPQSLSLIYEEIEKSWVLQDAELFLKSTSFDCGGRKINKDFQELIKSSQFPSIQIEVCEIKPEDSHLTAKIEVSIAGITKPFPVTIAIDNDKDSTYTSILKLNIEDFDLKAPTKMMGLIKVHEEISIHVNLHLEVSIKD